MLLKPEEGTFVDRREKLARRGPLACLVVLVLVVLLAVWLWRTSPLLINPWAVFSRLEADTMPEGTLSLMAAMLPVVMLACLGLLVAGAGLAFLAFSNERRHIRIIRRLTADASR
jgi:ABC-type enterobactin transport system permease subunit